jgi:hypothetical protein
VPRPSIVTAYRRVLCTGSVDYGAKNGVET